MLINRKKEPEIGDIKEIKKFLLFPRITKSQIGWLGFYILIYKRIEVYVSSDDYCEIWKLMEIKKIHKEK